MHTCMFDPGGRGGGGRGGREYTPIKVTGGAHGTFEEFKFGDWHCLGCENLK